MPTSPRPHPDRLAPTLLQVQAGASAAAGDYRQPGPGSADCRIDLKLQLYRARRAAAAHPAAAAHLEPFGETEHPDLWAGTVPDAVARGFAARLEEACSLAPAAPQATHLTADAEVLEGKPLRRKRDLLVASGGARARFTRKTGLLVVDRARDVHSENCLWFEARRDLGTLDGFVGADDERPRLFSAQFLQPRRYVVSTAGAQLVLEGRLGRGPTGWGCRLTLTGAADRRELGVAVELDDAAVGWRLRSRFLGLPSGYVHHECEPVREVVDGPRGGFVADTLIRSCAKLAVGEELWETPAAARPGPLRHQFWLGGPDDSERPTTQK
ncbi:MAG: hypothetical protein ACON4Z_13825 [Planctomycetota bacterium]